MGRPRNKSSANWVLWNVWLIWTDSEKVSETPSLCEFDSFCLVFMLFAFHLHHFTHIKFSLASNGRGLAIYIGLYTIRIDIKTLGTTLSNQLTAQLEVINSSWSFVATFIQPVWHFFPQGILSTAKAKMLANHLYFYINFIG